MHIFASRQYTDYASMSYAGAVEAHVARVCLVGKALWCWPRWPHRAVVLNLHLHRQRTLLSTINYIYLS